jgi:hypothetical protein
VPNKFDPNAYTGLKFITNYFLAGCTPPQWLVVDLSSEPQKDLAMLLLVPDLEDIVQDIFDPSNGRGRDSRRHGRKRRRGRFTLDTSTLIARPIRAQANPHNVARFTPLRFLFPIWNIYEGLNFTVAIVDGLSDVYFEHLWGIISVDQSSCSDLARLQREDPIGNSMGGLSPPIDGCSLGNLVTSNGFTSDRFTCTLEQDFHVAFQAQVTSTSLPRS